MRVHSDLGREMVSVLRPVGARRCHRAAILVAGNRFLGPEFRGGWKSSRPASRPGLSRRAGSARVSFSRFPPPPPLGLRRSNGRTLRSAPFPMNRSRSEGRKERLAGTRPCGIDLDADGPCLQADRAAIQARPAPHRYRFADHPPRAATREHFRQQPCSGMQQWINPRSVAIPTACETSVGISVRRA